MACLLLITVTVVTDRVVLNKDLFDITCVLRTCCNNYISHRRNLEYYDHAHQEKLWSCDPDSGPTAGELTIKIPKDVYSTPGLRGDSSVQLSLVSLCSEFLVYTIT